MTLTNKKRHPSPSTRTHAGKVTKKQNGAESSTFVAHPMVKVYKGGAHVSETAPIGGQQELLKYCLSGVRRHTSIRCDGLLWSNFKERCRVEGLSTCRVLEKLMLGWLVGVESGRSPIVTVQVDMPRVVKRVRRRQLVFEDEVEVTEVPAESEQPTCFICGGRAVGEAVHECGKRFLVCEKHLEELRLHPKWEVIV